MNSETLRILENAICDVGYLRWWTSAEDIYQIEFGGVQLFDETKNGFSARSSVIALQFLEKPTIVFLDKNGPNNWQDDLHNDKMEPINIEYDEFKFNDKDYLKNIISEYRINNLKNNSIEEVYKYPIFLAFKCYDFGIIIGGNKMKVIGSAGEFSEDKIKDCNIKWWKYWKEYWSLREKENSYDKDYACEVTIPVKE